MIHKMREDQIKAADFAVRFESLETAVFIRTDGNRL
jgi:hypothetical protein